MQGQAFVRPDKSIKGPNGCTGGHHGLPRAGEIYAFSVDICEGHDDDSDSPAPRMRAWERLSISIVPLQRSTPRNIPGRVFLRRPSRIGKLIGA